MRPRIFVTLAATVVVLAWCCSAAPNRRPPPDVGFVGTRGKRSAIPEEAGESKEKRAPSGFLGMRGKKPSSSSSSSFPVAATYPEEAALYDKRAPSGFLGMRGKKGEDFEEGDNYVDYFYKRAPSGFLGMRGRRDDIIYDDLFEEKRAPVGFLGMRGKKDFEDSVEAKRAPAAGFFGTRGKKLNRSGFFGTRGKKYPYEFRGKFVGVRGKKASNEVYGPEYYSNNELGRLAQELDWNQLMLLLTASDSNGVFSNDAPTQMK